MVQTPRRATLLFILGLGGFLALILVAGRPGPAAPWLTTAALVWFMGATLLRLVLKAAGRETGRTERGAIVGAGPGAESATPWG